MKSIVVFTFIWMFYLAHLGCSNKGSDENIAIEVGELSLGESLKELADELVSHDSVRIKNITTEKGYFSILKWSDGLNDLSFVNSLSKDLKCYNIADVSIWNDSMITLLLGERDETLGATHGYLVLKRLNNELMIDEFRGGK